MEGVLIPSHCKAVVYKRYFEPRSKDDKVSSVLEMDEKFPLPEEGANEMLVRVHACTVNPVDWKVIEGVFGRYIPSLLGGPKFSDKGTVPCADGSGVVVKSKSEQFPVGSEVVFDNGAAFGALSQYCVVKQSECAFKPPKVSFVDAASSVGLASGTAVMGCDYMLNFLVKQSGLSKSFKILVLGGAGGVGVSAIKYLKALGHTVYTTASARNVQFCKDAGADVVIDYKIHSWHEAIHEELDGIYQCVPSEGDLEKAEIKLTSRCCFISCASGTLGLLSNIVSTIGLKISAPFHYNLFLNKPSTQNLQKFSDLIDQGKISPTPPCQVFPLAQAGDAFDLSQSGKATGKIVIQIDH